MDEYQHMERFSMESDYTEGTWIGGEFFYRDRKEKHNVQTKEEALYGFLDESHSSDDDSRKKRRRGDVIKRNDFSKPVNFVSTGNVKPTEEVEKVIMDDDGDGERPGLGSRLGFKSSKGGREEEEEVVEDLLPSAFGKQILEAAEKKQRERESKIKQTVSKAKGTFEGSKTGGSDVGSFEKYTRGIGTKLLEKMGYKGGGLGKNQQGISAPIEAKLRPQKMGMGFNDFRESSTITGPAARPGEEAKENEGKVKQKPQDRLWHAKHRNLKKKEYRNAADLLTEKQGSEMVQTVLDMRGPQVRVLTNLENLNTNVASEQTKTPMPELQHNIRLIVELAEAEIQASGRKLQHEKDSRIICENETDRLQKDVLLQKHQTDVLESIMDSIQKLQEKTRVDGGSPESIARSFASIQNKYREEFEMYNLGVIGLSFSMPHIVALFRGWEPLQQPLHGIEVMKVWEELLYDSRGQEYAVFPAMDSLYGGITDPYTQLVMEAIMPAVRMSATNLWEPRNPEPMLRFLEAWEKLLPARVLQNILENLIIPKLTAAVDAWDPQVETVPIHAWLHPWLPLLGSRMEPLYPPIRYKLTTALQVWHPNDSSAYTLLSPWQAVFDAASWEQLLVRSIVPKLMYALQELVINPAHQQLDQFNWVMAWATALPIRRIAGMLEVGFFPKWQQTLYQWLCNNPNFEEVTQWYLLWKSFFPPELLANERVRQQLNMALDLMNQAVEGAPLVQPGARENISYLRVTEQRQFESQQHVAYQQQYGAPINRPMENSGAEDMTLKEVVQEFALNNDVQFMPKLGRVHEGLQVYGFGSVNLCVDSAKQVVLAHAGDRWVSVSLDQLLEMNHHGSGSRWK